MAIGYFIISIALAAFMLIMGIRFIKDQGECFVKDDSGETVEGEEQLLELFIELSTTAFLGIPFDEVALALIDDVLMNAEQVAQTFSVDDSTPQ